MYIVPYIQVRWTNEKKRTLKVYRRSLKDFLITRLEDKIATLLPVIIFRTLTIAMVMNLRISIMIIVISRFVINSMLIVDVTIYTLDCL